MKVNFEIPLKEYDGQDMKKAKVVGKEVVEQEKCVMLGDTIINALSGNYPDDAGVEPKEKLNRFALSIDLKNGGVTELTVEDSALIKKYCAKGCTILAYGRIVGLIESAEAEKEAKDG